MAENTMHISHENLYLDVACHLGDETNCYRDIPNYEEVLAKNNMPNMPALWGMGDFKQSNEGATSFIRTSVLSLIDEIRPCIGENNALLLCCPNTFDKDSFVKEVLASVDNRSPLNSNYVLPIASPDCTGIMSGLSVAASLISEGFDSVTLIGSEVTTRAEERMTNFAIYSDFISIVIVTKTPTRYRLRESKTYTVIEDVFGSEIENYDNANKRNMASVLEHYPANRIKMVHGMNLYKPITAGKYKKLGFRPDQLNLDSIETRAHCGGVDPFLSLRENENLYEYGDLLLLNTQGPGRSAVTVVEYSN